MIQHNLLLFQTCITLSNVEQKEDIFKNVSKYFPLCSMKERKSYQFGINSLELSFLGELSRLNINQWNKSDL